MRIDSFNRKPVKKEKNIIVIAAYAAIMTILILVIILASIKLYKSNHKGELTPEDIARQRVEDYSDAAYIGETYYDGADVPYACYNTPFITEAEKEMYQYPSKTNKEFIDTYGEEGTQLVIDEANTYVSGILGTNYREVVADTDAFIQNFIGHNTTDITISAENHTEETDGDAVSVTDTANKLAEMYVDNSITTDFELKTDKSLVWYKGYCYYCRGEIIVTYHSTEHKDGELVQELYDTLGIKAYYGQELSLLVDVGLLDDGRYSPDTLAFIVLE